MKRIRKWLIRLAVGFLILVVVIAAIGTWFVRRPWPQVDGAIEVSDLLETVEIVRDPWGVPHIYAENDHDLLFAQGYVHAQDRLWQMDISRRIASGTMTEAFGNIPGPLSVDRFMRTLGLRRTAEQFWADMDTENRALLEAYADGVNYYIETHTDRLPVEFFILGLQPDPWTPIDTLAYGNAMTLWLSGNYRIELIRMQMIAALGEETTEQIFPPFGEDMPLVIPEEDDLYSWANGAQFENLDDIFAWPGDPATAGWGSNNWSVGGELTESGLPLLANDMHLGITMPGIWYENGLHNGRFEVVGFSLPGVPLVVSGHNETIAWAVTNLGQDSMDYYIEKVDDPENPTQYEFMGEWNDLEVIHEVINVRNSDPVAFDILLTNHGPIMNDALGFNTQELAARGVDSERPLALRWTLHDGTNQLFQSMVKLNQAQNWEEFHESLRDWELPGLNFVYADVAGNFGYHASGMVPIRVPGHQGTVPVPGWTGEYEWTGYVPFAEIPATLNPSEGFVSTANNKVVPDDYPYTLTHEWFPGFRAQRIRDLLLAKDQLSREYMQQMQADTYSLPAEEIRPYLIAIEPENELQAQAINFVESWDLRFETDRVGASIYEAWYLFTMRNTIADELGEELEDSYLSGQYQRHGTQHVPMMIKTLQEPDNAWFDDVNTPEVEMRDDIIRRGLEDALAWLSENYGDNPEDWAWGNLHTVTFAHGAFGPLNNPIVNLIFNSKTYPAPGDQFTLNAATFTWNQPFTMVHGASQRMIVDMSDLDNSLAINNTGQCEQIFHPHREDLIPMWRDVQYHPMLFTRDAVETNADVILVLTPGE